ATHTIAGGAANGCDSIVTLNLTITNTVNSIDIQTACNTFTWIDGNTYTSSNNTATHTITGGATNGCDSIVTLNLTITNTVNSIDIQTACNTYTWIDGNTYTSNNSTAMHTIIGGAANGCDSIVTLNLTINNSVVATSTSTSCNPADVGTNMTGPFTMANGCDSTHYDTVSLASINVSAHASDTLIYQGNEIVLYSIGDNVTSYSWTANNNLISTDSSFTHTPNETATYYLLATNGDCEDVDSITIQVLLETAPLIPNSFTPNGDTHNDIFQVVNADKFRSVSIRVYNRWGEEVFNQSGSNPGWDGNFKLKEQPVDYYQYVISVESFTGEVTTVSGSLALFR
ncbi:MAG: gliding motility-associated C-terminal domain-containing protein, partial [Bacteroidetes bacterium]|nr:gliding motility-associated C-terminal domain-containing protein [Bacteroidota bacterium]